MGITFILFLGEIAGIYLLAPSMFTYEKSILNSGSPFKWESTVNNLKLDNQFIFLIGKPESGEAVDTDARITVILIGDGSVLSEYTVNYDISCVEEGCKSLLFLYEPYIEYSEYTVRIELLDDIGVENMQMSFGYVNEKFTLFEIIVKYSFLFGSVICLFSIIGGLKYSAGYLSSFEGNMIFMTSLSLILFNDPLFLVSVYHPSELPSGVSVFCVTQFPVFICFLWLSFLQNDLKFPCYKLFIAIEFLAIIITYGLVFSVYLHIHEKLRYTPSYDWTTDFSEAYESIHLPLILLSSVFWVILFAFVAVAMFKCDHFSIRKRLITLFNLIVILLGSIGLGIGGIQLFLCSELWMIGYIAGFNSYVYLLTYLYKPSLNYFEVEFPGYDGIETESEKALSNSRTK